MAVVDTNYEFIMVDVGVNGRVSDGGCIHETTFGQMMDADELSIPEPEKLHDDDLLYLPFVFLGDDAFALSENFMKPHGGEALDISKRIYNYAFGILASRFGVFQRAIQLSPDKAQTVTLACCYLHNFLRKKSKRYIVGGTADWEDPMGNVYAGTWRESQTELVGLQAILATEMRQPVPKLHETFPELFLQQRGSSLADESVIMNHVTYHESRIR